MKYRSQIVVLLAISAMASASTGAWPHRSKQRVRVRFLATSTLVRGTGGPNEDTYLAQILLPKQHEEVLVRLVDGYPNEFPPLSRQVLQSDAGAVLAVQRDMDCDRPFGEMPLRTAPGDPMAILHEPLAFQPPLDHTPAPQTTLPCYRVLRP